jgi:hypothetical protein
MLRSVTFKVCVVEMNELDNNDIIWQKQAHMTIIGIRVMIKVVVSNATFNSTSAISWRSVL